MERTAVLQADYLDIIFDHRNKSYGGYELRKHYPKRVKRAILFVVLSSGLISIASVFGNTHEKIVAKYQPKGDTLLADLSQKIKPPKIEPPKIQQPPASAHVATKIFSVPTVVENDKVKPDEQLSEVKDLKDKQIGTENKTGDATTSDISAPSDLKPGGGKTGEVESSAPPPPVKWVPQMPEFAGDIQEYLRNNIHYPEAARETGIQGRVVVQFVVNEDGDITDVQTLKGIGGGCEEEAMRVVRAMPHWKPGKNNGRAVRVIMSLPVTFTLE
ncbi:TonB family protein [Chitinophagaceae bacterium MMS25-I14]